MRIEASDQRDSDRLRPTAMDCNLGQIVDLSPTGARVVARHRLAGTQALVFTGADRKPLHLTARIMWCRKLDDGTHVHGLNFERTTVQQRAQIESLCRMLAEGMRAPVPDLLSRFGLSGIIMLVATLVFSAACLGWTYFNPVIAAALPGLHRLLNTVPELGALLIIAAGGCGLLAVVQRLSNPHTRAQRNADIASETEHSTGVPQPNELERMTRSQSVLNCILESSLGGVCVLETLRDHKDNIHGFQVQLINQAGEQLIGKPERELVGKTLKQALPALANHALYQDLIDIVSDGKPVQREYQIGGEGKWFLVAMVRLADGIAITFLDNTESQQHREQLKHIAYHDELTGLPNRKAFIEHVDSAITRTQRSPGHRSALLFLDFDRFKHVNDTLGHEAGDQLLINIAERLNENLRETDTYGSGASVHMPARLGGDEFVVLLDGINTTDDALAVAKRLLKVFAEPHTIVGQQIVSTASIGIAINTGQYISAEDILRDSDSAMYVAKQTGKGRYVLFDQDMQEKIVKRLRMEKDLRYAVERDELSLVYEPIIDLQTGHAAGFEALVRWTHPEQGKVSPAIFIPLAEELNLIGQIGEWVVAEACAQLARWREQGAEPRFLNVNISRGQLYEPTLVDVIAAQLKAHDIDPGKLRLELTETMVMNDLSFMADKLSQLKALGIGLALDDFGTGYSSLSVLHKLPFDTLKIDRAFLDEARAAAAFDQTRRSSAIICAITELADHLSLEVIAEGISAHEQVATLQALACRYAQGWHFSKPLDPENALDLMQNPTAHPSCLAEQLNIPA